MEFELAAAAGGGGGGGGGGVAHTYEMVGDQVDQLGHSLHMPTQDSVLLPLQPEEKRRRE
jgi:hypothetical protein